MENSESLSRKFCSDEYNRFKEYWIKNLQSKKDSNSIPGLTNDEIDNFIKLIEKDDHFSFLCLAVFFEMMSQSPKKGVSNDE